jgi:uncharacterized protein (DUF2141 family)
MMTNDDGLILGRIDRDGGGRPRPAEAVRRDPLTAFRVAILSGLLFLSPWRTAHADTTAACGAAEPNKAALRISVSGTRSAKGNITITIYPDEPSRFLDGAYKVARQQLPVTLPVTSACFALPAPGYYAVALFHDENDDHHLNTNALGIPTEGIGFSNNPTLYFGPPDLSRVRISLHPGDNPIAIRMKYY